MLDWPWSPRALKLSCMTDSDLRDAWPKLTIELKHDGPIPLSEFTRSLERLGQRYVREAREVGSDEDPQLYIAEIRKGSVVVDFITKTLPPVSEMLAASNALFTFAENLRGLIQKFSAPNPTGVSKADCDDMRAIAGPVIHTLNGDLNIFYNALGAEPIRLSQQSAIEVDNRAAVARLKLEQKEEHIWTSVLLVWDQVRDAPGKEEGRSPDRAIVAAIDHRARQVTFESEDLKEQMGRHGLHPFDKAFLVDVKVLVGPNGPLAYRVLKLHDVLDRE